MSPRDANFNEAAYLVQADTERKRDQNACAKLLELLRKHHPDHAPAEKLEGINKGRCLVTDGDP